MGFLLQVLVLASCLFQTEEYTVVGQHDGYYVGQNSSTQQLYFTDGDTDRPVHIGDKVIGVFNGPEDDDLVGVIVE